MYFTSFGCFSSNFHDVMWLTYVLKCIESDNLLFFWQSIREWLKLPFLVISKNSHWKLHMICINSDITKCCGTPWLSSVGIWLIRHLRPVTTHLVLLRTHCSRTPGPRQYREMPFPWRGVFVRTCVMETCPDGTQPHKSIEILSG